MWRVVTLIIVASGATGCGGLSGSTPGLSVIDVRSPVTLPAQIPARRIPVGIPNDYKPDLAVLPSGELLLVMFQPVTNPNGTYQENMILYRSGDGGQTWGARQVLPLLGREPYFSILRDGTLFITADFNAADYRNTEGYMYSIVYRSTDGGQTWSALSILDTDLPGAPVNSVNVLTRNILQLDDGSLVMGVSADSSTDYIWRSYDEGQTWEKSPSQVIGYDVSAGGVPWYGEMVLFQALNGDLLGIGRILANSLPPIPGTQIPTGASPSLVTRLVLFRSHDAGRTWALEPDMGSIGSYYGEMYPSFLRLPGGRILCTFTVRALRPPLGVQAVLGVETTTGFTLSFDSDRLILDQQTPLNQPSGGGFGNSVQLADGTMVTAYSYRGADSDTHAEVVRWRLPALPP